MHTQQVRFKWPLNGWMALLFIRQKRRQPRENKEGRRWRDMIRVPHTQHTHTHIYIRCFAPSHYIWSPDVSMYGPGVRTRECERCKDPKYSC